MKIPTYITRRALTGAMAGTVAGFVAGVTVERATAGLPPVATPDAALIAACDAYRGLMDTLNRGDHAEDGEGPIHDAYFACCATISEGEPQTVAGVLAMCRAIKAEARGRDGEPIAYHGTLAEDWARTVVDALLRLNGGAS